MIEGVQQTLRHFLSLVRFSHTLFALPFALLAALMAWHLRALELTKFAGPRRDELLKFTADTTPGTHIFLAPFSVRWQELLGILLAMISARSAAMAFNRLADRKLDAANARTAGRHLPAGVLSVGQVAAFAFACSLGFVASTLLFLPNRLPLYLAVPVLLFLLGYSYAKRFTPLAHFWLGAALALSPIAAWIAIRGEVLVQYPADLLPAIVLGAAVLAWVAGFDIIYACQDYEHDRRAKLHSVPVRLGIAGALRLAAACHVATMAWLACLPLVYPPLGWVYYAGVAAVAVLLAYEHALVRPDDLARVNTAFFHVNAVISLGLLAVGALDLALR
ncbi:MAG: 4-hydroxybenzoate octaprenyltransferase [Planctomycetota bacterium]|nr:MAG: 4-hydroxybenzoate octaprenyltransferase [Planctomycetota bacterium]